MFRKIFLTAALGLLTFAGAPRAQAACSSYPYTLTNGTTADATQVMANLNCAALTSGATLVNVSQIGVATSSPSYSLDVNGDVRFGAHIFTPTDELNLYSGTSALVLTAGGGSATLQIPPIWAGGNLTLQTDSGGGTVRAISNSNGVYLPVGGTAWSSLSDSRLKKDIRPLDPDEELSAIEKLRPVSFRWMDIKSPVERQSGFIAQEVRAIFPDLVNDIGQKSITRADGRKSEITNTLGLNYTGLIVPVVGAIQSLNARMKELKTANDNQASEIARLEAQVLALQRKLDMTTASR